MSSEATDPTQAGQQPPPPPPKQAPWPPPDQSTYSSIFDGNARLFGAVILIAAGIALFLNNVGLLPVVDIWRYWPLLLIVFGAGRVLGPRSNRQRISGGIEILVGVMFLGANLHWFEIHFSDGTWIVGVLLVMLGVALLAGKLDPTWRLYRWNERQTRHHWRRLRRDFRYQPPQQAGFGSMAFSASSDSQERVVHEAAHFSNVKRRVTTDAFSGGTVQAMFASVEIDLRLASFQAAAATIFIHCVFGNVKILVPPHWRVSTRIGGGFGSVEDKTLPLTRSDTGGPFLILQGTNVFGSVEIVN